ncbi:hypothetical protein AAL_03722 [Moelleriella libera RCEF 2490]|uniref:Uncharacterized protein n=1 Tax=Moelleriella libera RCEF 2490 TaxID=1081109 RepID=A0A162IPP0_9HYPO|nr:hypothetical protein AAL_03722 [Moelleriella libera RCEF 2490]
MHPAGILISIFALLRLVASSPTPRSALDWPTSHGVTCVEIDTFDTCASPAPDQDRTAESLF